MPVRWVPLFFFSSRRRHTRFDCDWISDVCSSDLPEEAEPMLAETRERPFTKAGWLFELKLDGYRVRAARDGGEAHLITRNGRDIAEAFPEIARALAALPYDDVILDGELVVPDDAGRPRFQRLQNRARVSRALDVRRAAVETPAVLYAFDLLAFAGYDLRPLPLERRKAVLERIVPPVGPIKYLEHFATDGEALYDQVVQLGLEGIVAKKADAPYRPGRSPNWLKIRADRSDDFAVGARSEEHTSELQSQSNLVCRLLLEKKKKNRKGTARSHADCTRSGRIA